MSEVESTPSPAGETVKGWREIMERLRLSARLLLQNGEACAVNHYGSDHELFGMPGWLADCEKDIKAAEDFLAAAPIPPTPMEGEYAGLIPKIVDDLCEVRDILNCDPNETAAQVASAVMASLAEWKVRVHDAERALAAEREKGVRLGIEAARDKIAVQTDWNDGMAALLELDPSHIAASDQTK
jgi:hypothetical protein